MFTTLSTPKGKKINWFKGPKFPQSGFNTSQHLVVGRIEYTEKKTEPNRRIME